MCLQVALPSGVRYRDVRVGGGSAPIKASAAACAMRRALLRSASCKLQAQVARRDANGNRPRVLGMSRTCAALAA
jgi:hypothetical protein